MYIYMTIYYIQDMHFSGLSMHLALGDIFQMNIIGKKSQFLMLKCSFAKAGIYHMYVGNCKHIYIYIYLLSLLLYLMRSE